MRDIFVSLGSNLGDRAKSLARAVSELETGLGTALTASSLYETEPWGFEKQPEFLNLCARASSDIAPLALLRMAKSIEKAMGRTKTVRWGPRVIDIDVLMMGDLAMDTKRLSLPHRLMWQRPFVVVPLAEIAPDLAGPGGRSCKDIAAELDPEGRVKLIGPLR